MFEVHCSRPGNNMRFLTLARAINWKRDNAKKLTRKMGSTKFWLVDTNQVGNAEVVDPTNKLVTVYVHGGSQ